GATPASWGNSYTTSVDATQDSFSLLFLIDAGVLRRQVGDAEVMRGQHGHLLDAAKRSNIFLQIVDPKCLVGLLGAFMIAELPHGQPDTVHVDSSAEGHVTMDPESVAATWKRYETIRLWAYPEHMSLKMIEDARREWT
ncbi:Scr1 family TA system antitoxin-like transcriptional regulator, partial [Streptosporangium sp. NPDC048047]|uniref:Scr1 family TA system antitoxin-like transcriptional regulator n=1 Tax=Streptosporangium sp. NPDC048047 TaxID=3155748 RepID=UPI003447F38E